MAASRTPKPTRADPADDRVPTAGLPPGLSLDHFNPRLPLAVALSGGADSMALLLACHRRWPGQVRAIHIHHGLQAAADSFVTHCQTWCERWQVPLWVEHVDARHATGESPEAAARTARYQAIHRALSTHWPEVQDVALAQHADDQIETLLLALSRGSGLPGMSAMPVSVQRQGLTYHRPWLRVPSSALREWLIQEGVAWVEDPSNADLRYTRNRIRNRLMPALEATFPGFRQTFARSAQHAAQAQTLLLELASQDAQLTGLPPRIADLRQLTDARMANVLRFWLDNQHGSDARASTVQLEQLVQQVRACSTRGHRIHVKIGRGQVQRQGETLGWYNS
jgi:tRNA(Ile)-lysidine synthase